MTSRLRFASILFAAGFLAFFILRAGILYFEPDISRGLSVQNSSYSMSWNFASDIKNYASFKRKGGLGGVMSMSGSGASSGAPSGGGVSAVSVDQKYEKVANIGLSSKDFSDDEKRIRELIAERNALIQFEQRKGLEGKRTLRLAVGVDPADFDAFVAKVQGFGRLTHLTIDKSDKTNEYRDLQARRRALEKTREALTALKTRDGEMPAMIELEKQILSLEQEIQGLGVSLGEFDTENEFVTVKMLLAETTAVQVAARGFLEIAAQALVWTLFYYPLFWLGVAMCVVAVYVSVQILRAIARFFRELDTGAGPRGTESNREPGNAGS